MSLQGNLIDIPLEDLLQILSVQGKTGVLTIYHKPNQAEIYFQNSVLFSAVIYNIIDGQVCFQGERALYKILGWSEGDFCFELQANLAIIQNVFASVDFLILEYEKHCDEEQHETCCGELAQLYPRLVADPPVRAQINLEIEEWQILLQINGHASIMDIAHTLHKEPKPVADMVASLEKKGLIEVASQRIGSPVLPNWSNTWTEIYSAKNDTRPVVKEKYHPTVSDVPTSPTPLPVYSFSNGNVYNGNDNLVSRETYGANVSAKAPVNPVPVYGFSNGEVYKQDLAQSAYSTAWSGGSDAPTPPPPVARSNLPKQGLLSRIMGKIRNL